MKRSRTWRDVLGQDRRPSERLGRLALRGGLMPDQDDRRPWRDIVDRSISNEMFRNATGHPRTRSETPERPDRLTLREAFHWLGRSSTTKRHPRPQTKRFRFQRKHSRTRRDVLGRDWRPSERGQLLANQGHLGSTYLTGHDWLGLRGSLRPTRMILDGTL